MLNLELNEKVRFHSTASELDGKVGRNLGQYAPQPNYSHYIILLDEPIDDRLAVVITEYCLTRI